LANPYKSTEVRKLEIMEAARLLIIRKGSEHLTVRNIARLIDLTEAAIYRHFRSKREILLYLSDLLTDQLVEDLQEALRAGEVNLRTVDQALRRHLSAIEQKRGLSFLVFAEILSFGDRKLNQKTAQNLDRYIRQLTELLQRGTRDCRARIDPPAAAQLLFGMIQGLVSLWAFNSYGFDLLRRYASLWRVFRRALLGGEKTPLSSEVVQGADDDDDQYGRDHAEADQL
jgi:AcrR family transcriptional regulator